MGNNIKAATERALSIPELAKIVKGRVVGTFDEKMRITGTCGVDKYIKNRVSFIRNRKYCCVLADLRNAVILIPEDLVELCQGNPQNVYIVVSDILNSMMDIQDFFYITSFVVPEERISKTAKIEEGVAIGKQVYVGEKAYVGKNVIIGNRTRISHGSCLLDNVVIGDDSHVYPGVCIYAGCVIGGGCIIHSGARIGVDGFRFEQDTGRKIVRKWLHAGKVVIGDRVEIGANSTVDRATFADDATVLCDDVKLDDQVHIGHNAKIGARTLIAAQTCISGSVCIGEDVWIGAGVTVSNGITIGDRAKVLLNAVVAYDVTQDNMISGFYAMPHVQWKHIYKKLIKKV